MAKPSEHTTNLATKRRRITTVWKERWQRSLSEITQQYGSSSFVEYEVALRELACHAYPKMDPKVRDELIKEQFICGINNTELQRKLLVLDGEKALQEVVELAESNETACISAR